MSLLPVTEAQQRLFALAPSLPVEQAAIAACTGRWLAHDLPALRDQPWADLSAMDGYAVRAAEQPGPWRVVATSSAGGTPPPPLAPGEACRIFTGAPLPPGADSIVMQENAAIDGDLLRAIDGTLEPGRHVRPAASDFAQGVSLLPAGTWLGPAQIALAWLLTRPSVSSLVIGARTEEQLAENLKTTGITLTDAEIAKLEAISRPPLLYPYWHQKSTASDRLSPADLALIGAHLG